MVQIDQSEVDEVVVAAVVAAGLPMPTSLKPLTDQGECNLALALHWPDTRRIVRINRDRDAAEFTKEAWCLARAAAAGVPAPVSLAHGQHDGKNYALHSDGGATPGTQHPDQLKLWHWLGQQARKLHSLPVDGFGERLEDQETASFADDWAEYRDGNLSAIPHEAAGLGLSAAENEWLAARLAPLRDAHLQTGLCHGDLSPRNVVVDDDGNPCLIDWGCAHAHIAPHYDLWEVVRLHGPTSPAASALLTGYGVPDNGPQHALLHEALSVMLLCTFDLMRWARDRAPDQLAAKRADFRRLVKQAAELTPPARDGLPLA